MRSVRTGVVVLGFVVTAIGVTSRLDTISPRLVPALFTALGIFCLAATIILGVGTYTVTEYPGRLTAAQRARLDQPSSPSRSERAELLRIYWNWTDLNEQEIDVNSTYLGATLLTLTLGILSLFIAGLQIAVPEVLPTCRNLAKMWCIGRVWVEIGVVGPVVALPFATKLLVNRLNQGLVR